MSDKIIAFDLGTGGNKASLFDADGTFIASVFVDYKTEYPRAGYHEQAPEDWYRAVRESTLALLKKTGLSGRAVRALALSGHSLGCVPLDDAGNLLREKTPIWSDSRAGEEARNFFEKIDPIDWYRRTGCGFPPAHYSIFKILWFQKHEPELFRRAALFIGTKDYINFRLTGRRATDPSYASGCGAYHLEKWDYDPELLDAAGISRHQLPEIIPSTEIVGPLTTAAAAELGLSPQTLVIAGGVDNSCMALGAGTFKPGRLYTSLGSSSWLAISSDKPVLDDHAKSYIFTHVVPGLFTSALAIFSSGTTFRWVRDHLCRDLLQKAVETGSDPYDLMTAEAALSPLGANGLLMNPSLAGGSSLDPTPEMRGGFLNLDLFNNRADLIRATMEGIALNMRIVLDTFRKITNTNDRMIAVGGGASSALWRQIYADALNITVEKTNIGQNAASLGAAALAGIGAGLWNSFDRIDELVQIQERAKPIPSNVTEYQNILLRFKEGINALASLRNKH